MNITTHALKRYVERGSERAVAHLKRGIESRIRAGIRVHPTRNAIKLMNNEYKDRIFIKHQDLVFVLSDDDTLVTVLQYDGKSFKKIEE